MFDTKERHLSRDGQKNHAELFALLSEAKHQFRDASRAATSAGSTTSKDSVAGSTIFAATLNALRYFPTADSLPTLDEVVFDGTQYDAVLPLPVLATLGYFRDDIRSVCLRELYFEPKHQYDNVIVAYPNTILWGQPALERLIGDLLRVFTGEPNRFPLLSHPQVRAYQLCRYGELILDHELTRIGEPRVARIFLPS